MTGCPYPVRLVVCERTQDQGKVSYYFLISNLSAQMYAAPKLVRFYNDRQTIEAFNKVMGSVLFLRHLRTGNIIANYAVAQLAMLAQNFLSWSGHTFFTGTPYEGIAIRELVQKGLRVVARVSWLQPGFCQTELSAESSYAQHLSLVRAGQLDNRHYPLCLILRRSDEKLNNFERSRTILCSGAGKSTWKDNS